MRVIVHTQRGSFTSLEEELTTEDIQWLKEGTRLGFTNMVLETATGTVLIPKAVMDTAVIEIVKEAT